MGSAVRLAHPLNRENRVTDVGKMSLRMSKTCADTLLDRISGAENLPSVPAVAIQVLRLIRQEEVAVTQIAATIERDPALSANILKVVNSPLFGMPNHVGSLPQAMVVLGLRTLKVMVLSFSMVSEFGRNFAEGFDQELFWRRSVTMAVSSRLLADKCDPAVRDEAFIGGLLADLGILAASLVAGEEYKQVLETYRRETRRLHDIESELMGVAHPEITASLLRKWKLPEELGAAALHHHDQEPPPLDQDGHCLTCLVWAAARISDLFCHDIPASELESIKSKIVGALADVTQSKNVSITITGIEEILDQVDREVCETADHISLDIGTTISHQELRMAAMAQLADLSVSAELDLAAASRKAEKAEARIERLSSEKRVLAKDVITDELTQLANRKAFNEEIESAVADSTESGRPLGLIMLDLDHFKKFNDKYGHLFGDEVLKVVGRSLAKVGSETRLVARYGGEEFAVICRNSTLKELAGAAEAIRSDIANIELSYGTKMVHITASLGVALTDPAKERIAVDQLIDKADQCLLGAKQAGRNRVVTAT